MGKVIWEGGNRPGFMGVKGVQSHRAYAKKGTMHNLEDSCNQLEILNNFIFKLVFSNSSLMEQ